MESNQNVETLKDVVIERLTQYFNENHLNNDEAVPDQARLAQGTLSAISRLLATYRVKDATQFAILRGISKDENQLEQYVQVMLPHLTPKKLLDRPKKKK